MTSRGRLKGTPTGHLSVGYMGRLERLEKTYVVGHILADYIAFIEPGSLRETPTRHI